MKPFISFLMIVCFANFSNAQTPKDYSELWEQVSHFENEGLPKSALEVVLSIEKKAKTSKNSPQEIKVLLFKSKYALILEEDAQLKVINDFKTAITTSDIPTKNVLQNILATLYWQYFSQNRWNFYNRTKTSEKVDETDFRTWDLQTLFDEIDSLYVQSLANGLILQQTDLKAFEPIITNQTDSKIYRPTLYDLLAHNALQFYKTDENSITKPAYKFEINQSEFLNSAPAFSKIRLESQDATSLQLQALKIYQNLIKFHLNDENPEALVAVDIERLAFVTQEATLDHKEALLLQTLQDERKKWDAKKQEVSALYDFEIAQLFQKQGAQYQPKTNETYRWKLKEALDICNSVIKAYPKSKGAEKCQILKAQIESQSLQITTEDYIPIQNNALALINYKNIEILSFKIAKVSDYEIKTLQAYSNRKDKQLEMLKNFKALKTWTSNLKNEYDYQQHGTEIAIPKLQNGRYVIFAEVSNTSNTYAFKTIQVSNIAYLQKENQGDITYQIFDRTNGKPISDAKITFSFIKNYQGDYQRQSFVTNVKGEFIVPKEKFSRSQITLNVETKDDRALFENLYLNRYYSNEYSVNKNTITNGFLFSDRSIYRPGQTVYFKGIIINTTANKSEIRANSDIEVSLYNTNNEILKTTKLKTNEYGSISGEFILPNDGLTGNFSIQLKGSNNLYAYHYISVEEYKRPKFEATFKPISETIKVNDTISVKGNAMAYAGSSITDAKVVYRVHRNVRYPSWYYWYRPYFKSEPQEIAHGETLSDASGNFEIKFKAIPDESIEASSLPIFNYEVTAEITDLNGETRSATTKVNVGYHSLTASLGIAQNLDKEESKHQINISTQNLNGEFVPSEGWIKIYKLKAPNTVLRPRPWPAPDYQEWSNSEFKVLFPHQAYTNEYDSKHWDKGQLVLEKAFDTETSKTLELGNIKRWDSGQYLVSLETKDRFGNIVKDQVQTTIYSDEDQTLADNQLFSITTNKTAYTTAETAEVTLGSAASNLYVTVEIEKNHTIISKQIIHLNNSKETIRIPITSEDLGGFIVHYSYGFQNHFQYGTITINVPYPPTDLEIETLTFRDRLQPGTDETWTFKIKGPQGEKVAAELLASMYDASLDQFKPHTWSFNPIQQPNYYSTYRINSGQSFRINRFNVENLEYYRGYFKPQAYDQLNFFGLRFGYQISKLLRGRAAGIEIVEDSSEIEMDAFSVSNAAPMEEKDEEFVKIRGIGSISESAAPLYIIDGKPANDIKDIDPDDILEMKVLKGDEAEALYGSKGRQGVVIITTKQGSNSFDTVKIRKNLQETAFFFPKLQTDAEGHVSFSFTTPEALTRWKLQLLAHTKTLESTTRTLETVTQKELMVIPNAPRFLRQGDSITISTKIANLTDQPLSGQAKLILTNPISGEDITTHLSLLPTNETVKFSVDAKGNTQTSWTLNIPSDVDAVQYKILAKAGDFSDGEQNALPVLSNRMLVTETLPMWIKSNETRTFTLDKLKTNTSTTLKHHKLTLEVTSNPAWYAVQALPYLMEYPYQCNEQTFSRYYANALASYIANSNPRIQEVFNQWKNSKALLSNLEKNQDLKSLLIQETPWLRDAQSETEQKKRMALLFDLNTMTNELNAAKRKLENNQMSNGAWAWFNGGRPNRYITQHIITGFGHLDKLGVTTKDASQMIEKALSYLDAEFVEEYKDLKKYNKDIDLTKDHLSYTQLHYLYMRSFYLNYKPSEEVQSIINYYQTQIQKYWLSRPLYAKGLMALVTNRLDDQLTSKKILKSLRETSITSEELGMYWKENTSSWYWYQAPIETQALMIEAFSELENDTTTIDHLKIWLLKHKQTNKWSTTKATTEAVYALLLQGSDWLSVTDRVAIVIGGKALEPSTLEAVKLEAGTGYYKTSWTPNAIDSKMASVKMTKKGDGIAWGGLYWQYFEDLDKITSAETPLKLKKKLFKKTNTDLGEEITEITKETPLNVGDLVRVRIELRSDRNMEFVHMKDMRAAGLEPINVLSQYKWQDGLGYYESTKDASTNFFFDYLPKGIYVFEYDLRVNNSGNMSNGITTIQSMYAPEFSSHSEGLRIAVD